MTPEEAQRLLIEGNRRFRENSPTQRNWQEQVKETSNGQKPFAAILSCIDSRTPAELIFDQGLGDIFSIRIAGNFVNDDILGSMEFACGVIGSKLILVLGHTHCGAITAACEGGGEGHIKTLLANLSPAVAPGQSVDETARINVELTLDRIRRESPLLADLEESGEIAILGALYDVRTGGVEFLQQANH